MIYIIKVFILLAVFLGGGRLFCNFTSNAIAQYLNVNKPIKDAEVLIIEGWMHPRLLKYLKAEFEKGTYRYILVSGMEKFPRTKKKIDSDSLRVTQELINMGIDSAKIKMVNCPETNIHHTFSMAFSARKWFRLNDPNIKRANLFSAWSHGRKSWCAYQRVFKNDIKVGILTFPKRKVPLREWAFRRGGFRYQLYSMVGYIYSALWPIDTLDQSIYFPK